jgi:hypothetical protein
MIASTSTLAFTGAGTKTFNGGNQTYATVSVGGSGTILIYAFNTFTTMTNTTQNTTILFAGGVSQTFVNSGSFTVTGTSGNPVTLGSTTAVPAVLYKPTTPWYVGANSVNGGNNTGLVFTAGGGIDYLNISSINGTNTPPPPPGVYSSGATYSGGYRISF